MLIRVGEERTRSIDLALAGWLSTIAGALNTVGFLVAGSFTANMTGNISLFAEHIGKMDLLLALSFLGLLGAFVCGAGVAAFAIQTGERHQVRSVYALAIVAEAAILLLLGVAFILQPERAREAHLIVVLCAVMGFQNAATTMISRAQVRTTHVSGMATDIGIELAAMAGNKTSRRDALPKLRLHCLTLACFATGGVSGAVLFGFVHHWLFVIAASMLLIIASPVIIGARSR